MLTGIPVIMTFAHKIMNKGVLIWPNKDLVKTSLFINRVMTFLKPSMIFIMNGITVLIVYTDAFGIDKPS